MDCDVAIKVLERELKAIDESLKCEKKYVKSHSESLTFSQKRLVLMQNERTAIKKTINFLKKNGHSTVNRS